MKHKSILILTLFFLSINLNGQSRIIRGRVLSEDLEPLPGLKIRDSNDSTLGITDMDGQFEINIDSQTDSLFFRYIGMEWTDVRLNQNCDLVEVLIMYDVLYHYISSKKIDRLRKRRFEDLSKKHYEAVEKDLFTSKNICFERSFEPYKPALDAISKNLKSQREEIKKAFKTLNIGDTVWVPYAGTWRYDGTDRTALFPFSYVVTGNEFDCIIKGKVIEKNKRKGSYNIIYEVIDIDACSYQNIALDKKEVSLGDTIAHDMKYFELLWDR